MRELIAGAITIAFERHQGNPHIKRLETLPVEEQIQRLRKESPHSFSIYPAETVLKQRSELEQFADRPFTRRLALGEPQLALAYFDLGVLERYSRDPRYQFDFGSFNGKISLTSTAYESEEVLDRDKVFLQAFGIGYDSNRDRVVGVFLCDLSNLSPEHQQYWHTYILAGPCTMNSDYVRTSICGELAEYRSAYRALRAEIIEINKLSELICRSHLFRDSFENQKLAGFHPMLRPTKRNFQDFVHLLDKMIGENINKDFFRGDISLEEEIEHENGMVEIRPISTLNLLRNWLRSNYRDANKNDVSDEVVNPLKRIRKLRQLPAHSIQTDEYDLALPRQQDDLVGHTLRSLTMIRYIFMAFMTDSEARDKYKPPAWLDGDKIVFY